MKKKSAPAAVLEQPAITPANVMALAAKVIDDQFAVQQKIFEFLNGWAAGKHMGQWSRVTHEDVIGQVYGDLAAHFAELKKVAGALKA